MAVLKDYKCAAHGFFESFEPRCPHGCTGGAVQVVFLQAPGILSDTTKNLSSLAYRMADGVGRSDFAAPMEGHAQPTRSVPDSLAPRWGNVDASLAANPLRSIRGESVGLNPSTEKIPGLRPSSVIRDPENLQVK